MTIIAKAELATTEVHTRIRRAGELLADGGGAVPAVEGEDDKDAYAELLEVGEDWLAVDCEA